MDVLSDVLLSVRLTGAVFAVDAAEAPVSLSAGDMVAFPAGDAHVLATVPGMRGEPDVSLYRRPPDRSLPIPLLMSREPAAERVRVACGFLGCDIRPFNPLLAALPRIVRAPISEPGRQWVAGLVDAAVQTTGDQAAGREALPAKLVELMFVEALRSHLARLPDDERGWLAGVRDPQIGAALRLIHTHPARPWTLDRLARGVGMSRSAFAERFTMFVAIPPMQYPGRWRLQVAARMLETGTVTVAQAATAVGYQSEAARRRSAGPSNARSASRPGRGGAARSTDPGGRARAGAMRVTPHAVGRTRVPLRSP